MMQVINNYASDAVTGFPSQIGAIDPTNPVGSSILGNHLLGYDAAGVLVYPDVLPLEVRQARDSLAQQLKQSVDDELRAERVLTSFAGDLTQAKIAVLTQTVIDLQVNENALRTSGQFCFDYWQQCLQEVASLYLRPIDRTLLEVPLPTTIDKGYSNYNGIVHYSNGAGQYWPVRTEGHRLVRKAFCTGHFCYRVGATVPISPVFDPNGRFHQLTALELAILPSMTKGVSLFINAYTLLENETYGFLPVVPVRDYAIFNSNCINPSFPDFFINGIWALRCI
jgi:hypothetical protein